MKAVQALSDDASHWYLVPNELCDEFNELMDKMYEDGFDDQDLIDIFESKFAQFRTGGDINNVQLYIE